jgi:hypothetical protein
MHTSGPLPQGLSARVVLARQEEALITMKDKLGSLQGAAACVRAPSAETSLQLHPPRLR